MQVQVLSPALSHIRMYVSFFMRKLSIHFLSFGATEDSYSNSYRFDGIFIFFRGQLFTFNAGKLIFCAPEPLHAAKEVKSRGTRVRQYH